MGWDLPWYAVSDVSLRALLDLTLYDLQQGWEDPPPGCPQDPEGMTTDGRRTPQKPA